MERRVTNQSGLPHLPGVPQVVISCAAVFRACLHGGGGSQIGEVTCGGSPQVSCYNDQIKMRDYVERRVTNQSGFPHLPGVPQVVSAVQQSLGPVYMEVGDPR